MEPVYFYTHFILSGFSVTLFNQKFNKSKRAFQLSNSLGFLLRWFKSIHICDIVQ